MRGFGPMALHAALGAVLACAACASSSTSRDEAAGGTPPASRTTAPRNVAAPSPRTTWGQPALVIARQPGVCSAAQPTQLGELSQSVLVLKRVTMPAQSASTVATCAIEGHPLVVFAVPSERRQAALETLLSPHVSYYSAGVGWVAIAAAPLDATRAMSLVQAVAQALGGSIIPGTAKP